MKTFFLLFVLSINVFSFEFVIDEFNLDLNLDQKEERLQLIKKNGLDYITLFSHDHKIVFQHEIIPMGKKSQLKKISHVKVNSDQQCLLAYYDEGQTNIKSIKKSMRLMSFCFQVNNLRKVKVQDLGYLFWDYLAVSSYQKLESELSMNNIFFKNRLSLILALKSEQRTRSWIFDTKSVQWLNLPERMYAEYAIKPMR
jgi:hypothetical protein